jgi:oxygen-dependent protoporphyrinogen oxidase
MQTLVAAINSAAQTAGATVLNGQRVTTIGRDGDKYVVATADQNFVTTKVIVALHPHGAQSILEPVLGHAPVLRGWPSTSVAMVLLAVRRDSARIDPTYSGYVATAQPGRAVTACSISSNKWKHLSTTNAHILRVGVGRASDPSYLELDDTQLVQRVLTELAATFGWRRPQLAESRVARWPNSFPQYQVGHAARLASVSALVAKSPGLALIGNAYSGVGIAPSIAYAQAQANRVS